MERRCQHQYLYQCCQFQTDTIGGGGGIILKKLIKVIMLHAKMLSAFNLVKHGVFEYAYLDDLALRKNYAK